MNTPHDPALEKERLEWEEYAEALPLFAGAEAVPDHIGGCDCLWLRPDGAKPGTILYAHGGGLVSGSIKTHRSFASELAVKTGRAVLLPQYRLLPENPIEAPRDDFLSVYNDLININKTPCDQIAFGGDSSGAAVAYAALAALGKDAAPACLFTLSAALDATLSGASQRTNAALDPLLTRQGLAHWQSQIAPLGGLNDPILSPLLSDQSPKLPVLALAGGLEVWLDDTTRMHEKRIAAGLPSEMHVFKDMWHVWPMASGLPETDEAFDIISKFIAKHLS